MLEELLSKLGASTRTTVGVSISPNVGLEMIEIDCNTGVITKYSYRELEYNHSLREIADIDQFRVALEEMFIELGIPKRSNVVVSMPNVYFGTITLPTLLPDDGITNAIVSEVEQSYIFKRSEPVVSWSDVSFNSSSDSRLIAYSAVQKSSVDAIKEVFDELGYKLVCIETSYNSLFRALSYVKATEAQMADGVSWNLMLVTPNSYAILSMVGTRPIDYFEEPLALKTFVDEEIYNAIKTSAQLTLMGLPANYLTIVSETDLVSAEILSMKLPFDGKVTFFESNKFTQKELMPISLNVLQSKSKLVTANAIGAGCWLFYDYPLKLNFIQRDAESEFDDDQDYPRVVIGNLEVELTPIFIKKSALVISLLVFLPLIVLLMTLNSIFIPNAEKRIRTADSKIRQSQGVIKEHQEKNKNVTFDAYNSINDVLKNNKKKLTYYSALGHAIPDNLWISYYETDDDARVDIKGSTGNPQSIYVFFRVMRQIVNDSKVTLKRLELSANSLDTLALASPDGNKMYQFEITDMPNAGSGSVKFRAEEDDSDVGLEEDGGKSAQKSLFELGQPWLESADEENTGAGSRRSGNSSVNGDMPENLQRIEKF